MPKIEVAYITLKRSLESSDMLEKVKIMTERNTCLLERKDLQHLRLTLRYALQVRG